MSDVFPEIDKTSFAVVGDIVVPLLLQYPIAPEVGAVVVNVPFPPEV